MLQNPTIVKLAEIRYQQSVMKTEKEQLEVQKENQKAQFTSPEKWSWKRKVSLVLRAAEKTGKRGLSASFGSADKKVAGDLGGLSFYGTFKADARLQGVEKLNVR